MHLRLLKKIYYINLVCRWLFNQIYIILYIGNLDDNLFELFGITLIYCQCKYVCIKYEYEHQPIPKPAVTFIVTVFFLYFYNFYGHMHSHFMYYIRYNFIVLSYLYVRCSMSLHVKLCDKLCVEYLVIIQFIFIIICLFLSLTNLISVLNI